MINRRDEESPDALVLMHALEKLRARDGLTRARLEISRSDEVSALFELASVRRYADVHNVELSRATVEVIAECVKESLHDTQQIVADAVLALGMFADMYAAHGVEERVVSVLQSGLLGRRREALLTRWRALHQALDLPISDPPSDRRLRGTLEPEILRELARQLVRREEFSFGSKSVVTMPNPAPTSGQRGPGKVIVVGGAVMDAIFKTKELPARQTSHEAFAFDLRPGGKGLQQAIAAARLGLDVSLVAAVAKDRFGQEIIDYLQDQNVNTSLIKWVDDARTPFTNVIEFELGDSVALNWRNEREVRLDSRDVEQLAQQLAGCDAVLLTFELPRDTLERTLALLSTLPEPRPIVIVTPGQPYTDGQVSGQAFSHIDYLVARAWELGRYSPSGQDRFDVDPAARQLLAYGVENLCILGIGCNIYSQTLGAFTVPTFPAAYLETSATRDAFCAALAAKLIDRSRQFDEDVALWAAAAMSAAMADHPLLNPMPDRQRVDQILDRSRFALTPRHSIGEEPDPHGK